MVLNGKAIKQTVKQDPGIRNLKFSLTQKDISQVQYVTMRIVVLQERRRALDAVITAVEQ